MTLINKLKQEVESSRKFPTSECYIKFSRFRFFLKTYIYILYVAVVYVTWTSFCFRLLWTHPMRKSDVWF